MKKLLKKSEYFMKVAELTSDNSTCTKKHVGAVLVREGKILATGYNGAPAKVPHCTEESCLRKLDLDNKNPELCRGVHAEVNCIVQCAIHGTQIGKDAVIYCTHFPCMACTKLIINAKIKTIVFHHDYEMGNIEKMKILEESPVDVYRFFWNFTKTEHELQRFNVSEKVIELHRKIKKFH